MPLSEGAQSLGRDVGCGCRWLPGGLDRRICAPAKWRSAPARRAALCRSHRRRARGACDHRSRYTDRPAGAGGPRRADRRQRGAITIFAFGIFSKIREVDAVLQSDRALDGRVRETHPELAFWRLNGGCPLASAKKTKAGLALRRRLLIEAGLAPAMVNGAPPKGAGPDDLLDALVCAAIAARIDRGLARPFPDPPERDACGLPMAIWA